MEWSLFSWRGKNSPSAKMGRDRETYKCLVHITGKTLNAHKDILDPLRKEIRLQEVSTEDECDFILVFCPIVSRAGTDIEAAVKMLHTNSNIKPAVLVVIHYTFDPECVVPDSSRSVNRKNTTVVDCLFHEDMGLLRCTKNHQSLSKIITDIKSQGKGQHTKPNKQEERVTSDIELRNRDPTNMEKDRLSEETRERTQYERDRQTNLEKESEHDTQIYIEKLEKSLEERQKKEKEELKKTTQILTNREETLSETRAKLIKTNDELQKAKEHIKKQNTQLENRNKLLSEKETQLKKTNKELETSKNKLETLGEELQDKKRQLQEQMIVLEQQKTELAEKNKQLEEKERLLTERETQLMERDKQLQEKDKTLEEKDTLLREVKELGKANRISEENQTQMKDSDRERKLENVGKEPETSKQNLLEKEKQICEKDRPLAETREQKGAQCKQDEGQEGGATIGPEDLPGRKHNLKSENESHENKNQEIKFQTENQNTNVNHENLTQEEGTVSKNTNGEFEKTAEEPQERENAGQPHQQQEPNDTQIEVEGVEKNLEKDKESNEKNEHQKVQDTQQKEKETVGNEQVEMNKKNRSEAGAELMEAKESNVTEKQQKREEPEVKEANLPETQTEQKESDTQLDKDRPHVSNTQLYMENEADEEQDLLLGEGEHHPLDAEAPSS